jgi:hypothetical protein
MVHVAWGASCVVYLTLRPDEYELALVQLPTSMWGAQRSNATLKLTWTGVKPAAVVHFLDESERVSSWRLGQLLGLPSDAAAWGRTVAGLCQAKLNEKVKPNPVFRALFEERKRMLLLCSKSG